MFARKSTPFLGKSAEMTNKTPKMVDIIGRFAKTGSASVLLNQTNTITIRRILQSEILCRRRGRQNGERPCKPAPSRLPRANCGMRPPEWPPCAKGAVGKADWGIVRLAEAQGPRQNEPRSKPISLQSLRHGFAVPPPLAQGRYCRAASFSARRLRGAPSE